MKKKHEIQKQKKSNKTHHKREISRKTKLNLIFNDESRKEYLTGFRKRKQERKEYHIKKLEKQITEERQRLKQQAKLKFGKDTKSGSIVPEVENLIDYKKEEDEEIPDTSQSFTVGAKTIIIKNLDIPKKTFKIQEESDEEEEEEDSIANRANQANNQQGPSKKTLKQTHKSNQKIIQNSKAYKKIQKIHSKKHAKKNGHLQKRTSSKSANKKKSLRNNFNDPAKKEKTGSSKNKKGFNKKR